MNTWDQFFRDKCISILTSTNEVVDIGGGLRVDGSKNNRVQKDRSWLWEYVQKVNYKILDPVPDYNPDIVGDIHNLPFKDESTEAIFCLAVLEHVQNPIKAMEEMHRVLVPGGKLLIYVPFLYYYHAHEGYYGDYWRFTYDTLKMFAEDFTSHELVSVRNPVETVLHLTPLGRSRVFVMLAGWFDNLFYSRKDSKQVSGYYLYLEK